MVTEAPRGPIDSEAPDLLMLTRTPGKSLMRFENLNPMTYSRVGSAAYENAADRPLEPLNDLAAVAVVREIRSRYVYT